jgi:hypothetical protein
MGKAVPGGYNGRKGGYRAGLWRPRLLSEEKKMGEVYVQNSQSETRVNLLYRLKTYKK